MVILIYSYQLAKVKRFITDWYTINVGLTMNKFAERLKELREEKNFSQSELARQLHISVACINRWENNLRIPNIESIIALCKFFSCTADYLIGLED